MKKIILIIILVALGLGFLYCVYSIGAYFWESSQAQQVFDDLAQIVEQAKPTEPPTDGGETQTPTEPPSPYVDVINSKTGEKVQVLREYAEIYEKNSDLVGWLKIEGTSINYPVMQTPDRPDYYLTRDFYGNSSSHGCLYAQENCDVLTPGDNIVIYGHNMKDGSMFAGIFGYIYPEFWEEHRYITFDTITEHRTYEVFVLFDTTASKDEGFAYHTFTNASGEEEFNWFVDNCRALAYRKSDIPVAYGDSFICLSTCEYSQANGRLVLVAKLVK